VAGVVLGLCLLGFCAGMLAVGRFYLHLDAGALQTLAFLLLVYGSQGTIYAVRERRHLWNSRPSLLLALSSLVDLGIAATLAIAGIAMAPVTALLVAGTLAAAVVFALALDLIKVPVFAHLGIAESASAPASGVRAAPAREIKPTP
jgi:H+-transporting ATPase